MTHYPKEHPDNPREQGPDMPRPEHAKAPQGTQGEFSVAQWFPNGDYEYVRRFVGAEEAVYTAKHYCTCVGAKIGTTVRVMITDGGDHCVFEWNRDDGVTFPEQFRGMYKKGQP